MQKANAIELGSDETSSMIMYTSSSIVNHPDILGEKRLLSIAPKSDA
jgi:hypothetical protein